MVSTRRRGKQQQEEEKEELLDTQHVEVEQEQGDGKGNKQQKGKKKQVKGNTRKQTADQEAEKTAEDSHMKEAAGQHEDAVPHTSPTTAPDDAAHNNHTAVEPTPKPHDEEEGELEEGMVVGEHAPQASPHKIHEPRGTSPSFDLKTDPRYADIDDNALQKLTDALSYTKHGPDVFDDKVLHQIRNLPPNEAMEILDKLNKSVRTSNVRNLSAYLAGVIRRSATAFGEYGSIEDLVPEARDVLEELYQRGFVIRGELDGKSLYQLAKKSPEIQVLVMDTFADRNLRGIRNMAAYFTAHQNQVERDLRDGRLRLPRLGGGKDVQRAKPSHEAHPVSSTYNYVPTAQRATALPTTTVPVQPEVHAPYDPQALHGLYQPTASVPAIVPHAAPAAVQPKHYALEQVQWGVRVDEFQALSPYAKYVHPAAALQLQQLWDVDQNKLVSVLDENSWVALASLDAPSSVKVVNEVAEKMKTAPDDLITINAMFIQAASKYPRREDAPPALTAPPTQIQTSAPMTTQPFSSSYQPTIPRYDVRPTAVVQPQYNTPVQLPGPCGALSPALQSKIDEILGMRSGQLMLDHFDDRVADMLKSMDEGAALRTLTEFSRNDPKNMRNPTAYLIGCLRRAGGAGSHGERRGPGHRRGGRGRGRGSQRYEPY